MLHSSVVSAQIEYVRFSQGGPDTTLTVECSDPLETVSISALTPTTRTSDLTIKVKLKGPDNTLSTEITAVVPSSQIENVPTFVTSGVELLLDAGNTASYPGTGSMWTDLSGNGRNATIAGGGQSATVPTYGSSNGGYIDFDSSKYQKGTGNIPASVCTGAHTISCWFNRRSTWRSAGLFQIGGSLLGFGYSTNGILTNSLGTYNAGSGRFDAPDGIYASLGSDHLSQWIYATIVYSGSTIGSAVNVYAYKGGNLVTASGALTYDLVPQSKYSVAIEGAYFYDGYVSHVSVHSRALSAAEIQQNYDTHKARYGFVAPSVLTDFAIPAAGTLQVGRTSSGCSVKIAGAAYNPVSNKAVDFKVHLFPSSSLPPYTAPATPNATVTSFTSATGVLVFSVLPTVSGTGQTIVVFVTGTLGVSTLTVAVPSASGVYA
jgi:hypothetical protein